MSTDDATARHRSGRRGSGVARWVWALPLTLVVVAALVVGWTVLIRGAGDDDTPTCINGDLPLAVWADPATVQDADAVVARYAATSPVVRDFCVRPTVVVRANTDAAAAYAARTPGSAAVWLPVGTDILAGLPGVPADPPVVAETTDGAPVPLVVFGSSDAVDEDAARAGADLLKTVGGEKN